MEKQQRIEELKKEIEDLMEEMNGSQLDFIDQYMVTYHRNNNEITKTFESLIYLDDAMHEFADSEVSVYYSDQREYYYNNQAACDNAFREYEYNLNDFYSIDDALCKAGAVGWYAEVYDALCNFNRLEELNDLIEELEELEDEN